MELVRRAVTRINVTRVLASALEMKLTNKAQLNIATSYFDEFQNLKDFGVNQAQN